MIASDAEKARTLYCRRCLESVFRPGQELDESGVCRACRYAESHHTTDWASRRLELDEIVREAKQSAKGPYDCLIGVSGGKDSLRQAMIVRDELGLKPLLVCLSYPPEQQTERGTRNLSNLVEKGFDLQFISPAPETWKQMMRIGFLEHAQWTRSTELALFSAVAKAAVLNEISLAILGENPALAFGAKTGTDKADAAGFRDYDTLKGGSLRPWLDVGISRNKLYWHDIPTPEVCDAHKLRMIYLGYFIQDFHDIGNTRFAKENGFAPRVGRDADPAYTGSINPYESVDEDFVHVNQYLKSVKLGFGKVIQQVSVQVRYGTMTREEAIKFATEYDGIIDDELIENFCGYLGIDRKTFDAVETRIRNRDLWRLNNQGEWEHRYPPSALLTRDEEMPEAPEQGAAE